MALPISIMTCFWTPFCVLGFMQIATAAVSSMGATAVPCLEEKSFCYRFLQPLAFTFFLCPVQRRHLSLGAVTWLFHLGTNSPPS